MSVANRACNNCRHRKIRCDRAFPCSGCRTSGVQCVPSKGVERPKNTRVLISSQYERKIDLIEEKLDRLGNLVEALSSQLAPPMPESLHVATPAPSCRNCTIQQRLEKPSRSLSVPVKKDEIPKGQSSLSAHSSFAVAFLHKVIGREQGNSAEAGYQALIDTVAPIVDAFSSRANRPTTLFPYAESGSSPDAQGNEMPPVKAAMTVLRLSEGEGNMDAQWMIGLFKQFLPSQSLPNLCFKIYSAQDHTEAEVIILNAALYFLATFIQAENQSQADSEKKDCETLIDTCRAGLETALSQLSLYTEPSYEMAFALTLGAIYAIENARNSLASVLVRATSHAVLYLEYHSRSVGVDASGSLNNQGLLFWIVYYLEKMLSLRNGQSSLILDAEITLPLPSDDLSFDSHLIRSLRNSIKVAGLAGRIYTALYCADSLSIPADARGQRVTNLSQELEELSKEATVVNELWAESARRPDVKRTIKSMLLSDEVLRLSMATLVHRAMPVQGCSVSTFTHQCVHSARTALENHQAFILEFGMVGSSILTSHITWSILFVPFVPFIVLFCHVIETGNVEDLSSMQAFVTSIQSACPHSSAIAKHHRLFQVFCDVATRYCELKSRSARVRPEQIELRKELDARLSTCAFQPQPFPFRPVGSEDAHAQHRHVAAVVAGSESQGGDLNLEGDALNLGDWFSFSQNMMAFLDTDAVPF